MEPEPATSPSPHEGELRSKKSFADLTGTAAEIADLIGTTAKTVYQLADRGIVIRAGRGRYNMRASIRGYSEHLRSIATGRAGGEAVAAAAAGARARLAGALADKAELANAHARGRLVDAEAVLKEWTDILRMVRARMMAVPTRCGARLPHLTAHDLTTIEGEVRDALTEAGEGRA
jgi:phage terminase Nu1 subunit (DNA packaging protein)